MRGYILLEEKTHFEKTVENGSSVIGVSTAIRLIKMMY